MARFNDDNKIADTVPSGPSVISINDLKDIFNGVVDGYTILYVNTTGNIYTSVFSFPRTVSKSVNQMLTDNEITLLGKLPGV